MKSLEMAIFSRVTGPGQLQTCQYSWHFYPLDFYSTHIASVLNGMTLTILLLLWTRRSLSRKQVSRINHPLTSGKVIPFIKSNHSSWCREEMTSCISFFFLPGRYSTRINYQAKLHAWLAKLWGNTYPLSQNLLHRCFIFWRNYFSCKLLYYAWSVDIIGTDLFKSSIRQREKILIQKDDICRSHNICMRSKSITNAWVEC